MQCSIRKVLVASFIGATIELYDYFIYGTGIPRAVLARLLRTGRNHLVSLHLRRRFRRQALGDVVFGHYGDKVGRKARLVTTLLIMGVANFLVGCLLIFEHPRALTRLCKGVPRWGSGLRFSRRRG